MPTAFLAPRGSLRRDLKVSAIDAIAFSVMVGCGESYLPAFALALGLGPVSSGLVASVPILVGAVVQLAAPLAVARVGSHRRWVIACTIVQSACFVPFVWWAIRGQAELWQLLTAASGYWAAGMAGGPAWTAWMADMVPDRVRTPYFAQRNRLGQFGVFLGFIVGGLVLQWGEQREQLLPAFAILFVFAAASRLFSTGCLWACREPAGSWRGAAADGGPFPRPPLVTRITAAVRRMARRPSGPLVAYLCSFMFGAHLAGPYFTPFMLRELGFSYHAYMFVFGTSFLAKALLLPAIGRLASRIGSLRLLWGASLAIVPLALLWIVSGDIAYLCGVQVVAGGCWAAYELAVTLLFFELLGERERAGVVTVYNLGIAVATVAGAACGGALLRALGETWEAYVAVFVVSSLTRLAMTPLLRRVVPAG